MKNCITPDTHIENTGFGYTLSIIGGKYKMIILYWLGEFEVLRHNALYRLIGKISFKMLSSTLKGMEADGLIIRTAYPQIPPKVEYSLSEKGKSLLPILFALCEWGDKNRPVYNKKSRKVF
ncbi:MAG: helix-turn-helix transcriptional regulator [Alistipes senegalensis]|nr:helix-turn-helix transcriptional regulator [Oxalobacter formigenes]MCM1281678.1 helix-turn-helix transcriptional regulator [Alistipes senegalensis]